MQIRLEENEWKGGVQLDAAMFREIVRPSFCTIKTEKPDKLYLPMQIDDERACRILVKPGDIVPKYGIVGQYDIEDAAHFHVVRTAYAGYVERIFQRKLNFRQSEQYVVLNVQHEKKEALDADRLKAPDIEHVPERMRELLKVSGIPGINRILFHGNRPAHCKTVILNAVTDDPSVFYDRQMINERSGQLLYGLLIFFHLLEADKILIVMNEGMNDAMCRLKKTIGRHLDTVMQARFVFALMPDIYPGGQDTLVIENLKLFLTEKSFAMVHVDQTLSAYDMIFEQQPCVMRHMIVGGASKDNGIYPVAVGTSLKDWLPFAESEAAMTDAVIIDGGFMHGKACHPLQTVVHAKMQTLLILPRIEENEAVCCHCHQCRSVCPAGLDPAVTANAAAKNRAQCMACGCCSYICPARRRLKEYIVRGGQRSEKAAHQNGYIPLPDDGGGLLPAAITGYSSPYIRQAGKPFTCILSPFKL